MNSPLSQARKHGKNSHAHHPSAHIERVYFFMFFLTLAFPFVQVIDSSSYNQPNSFILASLGTPFLFSWAIRSIKGLPILFLSYFLLLAGFHMLTLEGEIGYLEIKNLLPYLSVPIISLALLRGVTRHKADLLAILKAGILVWGFTGVIQYFFYADFMRLIVSGHSETQNMLESGRGVMSLAPEPTHYGFHMILLAAAVYLIEGRSKIMLLAIAQAVFPALSAGSIFVIILSITIAAIFSNFRRLTSLAVLLAPLMLTTYYVTQYTDGSRIGSLLSALTFNPANIFQDYSVNVRILGMLISLFEIVKSGLWPFGISSLTWLEFSAQILIDWPALFALSNSGVPSGLGVLLFQSGVLLIPPLAVIIYALTKTASLSRDYWIILSAAFVSLMQYSFASPDLLLFFVLLASSRFRLFLSNRAF